MKETVAIPVILSLMVFSLGAGWAVAQTQPAGEEATIRELFTEVSPGALSAQLLQDRPDLEIVRSRFVKVNLDRLDELESIALNFLEDVTITAVRERVEYRSEGRYTWFGEVPGKEFSDVVLTIENGILVGGVRIDGKLYRVEHLQDELHIVRQLDPKAFPRDKSSDVIFPDWDVRSTPLLESQDYHDDGSTIDIMVVYTNDAASSSIGAQIQYAVDLTNATYAKSQINQRLRLVHTAKVNYGETRTQKGQDILNCIVNKNDSCLDEIHAWRDQYRADIVSFWVEGCLSCEGWDVGCVFTCTTNGIAKLMTSLDPGFAERAFNVVRRKYASDDFVLAHEAGHNMGAGHDIHAPDHVGIFAYSHGYVWTGSTWYGYKFCRPTVMAYYTYCENNVLLDMERIGRWSNPNINWRECDVFGSCTNSTRLGIPGSTENARTLNETAYTVANFRQSKRPRVTVNPNSLNFGVIHIGSMSGGKISTISNLGDENLTISGTSIAGTDSSLFSVSLQGTDACTSLSPTLPPSAHCTVVVRFSPNTTGPKSASLRIASNDPASPVVNVSLAGSGTATCPFSDVTEGSFAEHYINTIFYNGITSGCGGGKFCPNAPVTRAQMAVFLEKGMRGSDYVPPAAGGIFSDVPIAPVKYWGADWIEQLYDDGITSGCSVSPLAYCPESAVTRAQIAVFVLKALGEAPAAVCTGSVFNDVNASMYPAPLGDVFCRYIEKFAKLGITSGCQPDNRWIPGNQARYCPNDSISRAQMAVFLTKAFLQ